MSKSRFLNSKINVLLLSAILATSTPLSIALSLSTPVYANDNAETVQADDEMKNCYGYQSLKLLDDPLILSTYLDLCDHVGRYDGSFTSEELYFQKPLTEKQFSTAWFAFRGDTPQYFWYSPYFPVLNESNEDSDKYSSCIIKYSYDSKDELDLAKEQFDSAVENFMSNSMANKDMSELLRELILYKEVGDYIHVEDVEDMEQLTYRALVEKRGSCLGVSDAFAYILQKNGIMAYVVNGEVDEGKAHAFVLVRLDDNFVWCDLTWDANEDNIKAEYLNMSSQDFQASHDFIGNYIIPYCNTTLEDLFSDRNGIISNRDVNDAIEKFLSSGEKIGNVWYVPIYVNGDFSSFNDFYSWWDADNLSNSKNSLDILHGFAPSFTNALGIVELGNVWIITIIEGEDDSDSAVG